MSSGCSAPQGTETLQVCFAWGWYSRSHPVRGQLKDLRMFNPEEKQLGSRQSYRAWEPRGPVRGHYRESVLNFPALSVYFCSFLLHVSLKPEFLCCSSPRCGGLCGRVWWKAPPPAISKLQDPGSLVLFLLLNPSLSPVSCSPQGRGSDWSSLEQMLLRGRATEVL